MIDDSNWPMERDAFLASPAPRRVPPMVSKRALAGKKAGLVIGLLFLVIGIVVCWFFLPVRWIDEWRIDTGPSKTVMGRVVKLGETNVEVSGNRVWKHEFVYRAEDGDERRGEAFSTGKRWTQNSKVKVQYLISNPDVAKVVGARLEASPRWLLFILAFPLAGAGVVSGIYASQRRIKRLLRNGMLSSAKIEAVDGTLTEINGNKVHKIRMNFPEGGDIVRKTWDGGEISTAFRKKESGEPVTVLYDPMKPKRLLFPESWEGDVDISPARYFQENPGARELRKPAKMRDEVELFLGMPTPRRIPQWLSKRNSAGCVGWFLMLFGAVFLTVGLFGTWTMAPWHLPKQWKLDEGKSATASGTIIGTEDAKVSVNDVKVYRHPYRFQSEDGSNVEGVAYRDGDSWKAGDKVEVRYLKADPSVSVPRGGRMGLGSPAFLFILIFPLIGATVITIPLIFLLRRRRILREGKVATARVGGLRKTNVTINDQPQYAISMLRDDGVEVVKKTHLPDEVALATKKKNRDETIVILHDVMKPNRLMFPEAW